MNRINVLLITLAKWNEMADKVYHKYNVPTGSPTVQLYDTFAVQYGTYGLIILDAQLKVSGVTDLINSTTSADSLYGDKGTYTDLNKTHLLILGADSKIYEAVYKEADKKHILTETEFAKSYNPTGFAPVVEQKTNWLAIGAAAAGGVVLGMVID